MERELYFNEDGNFKILQFTDIHFTNDSEPDHKTTALMGRILEAERPDFIMLTGDTVYGPDNTKFVEKALAPVTETGIPWSFVFGNHDTEEGVGYEELFPAFTALPNCRAFNADASVQGTGNHFLKVKTREGETRWVLFGIDSGAYNDLSSVGGYDYVKESQSSWYKNTIREVEYESGDFSSLVFQHIPLPEYNEVWETQNCYGEKREEVCCPNINSGFFTAMLEAGHTKGVFAGHDHINDYIGTLYGIRLAYGRATGYNTYGQEGYLRGARVILLNDKNTESFRTYIRLEDGTVIKEQQPHQPGKRVNIRE